MTLGRMVNYFSEVYSRRNRIFLSGLRKRIDFLNLAIGDLQDAIRKEAGEKKLTVALARVTSRVFCVAENFQKLPLVEMMCRKYPTYGCAYCNRQPCSCSERRSNAVLQDTATEGQ